MRNLACSLLVSALGVTTALAQQPPAPKKSFEVASIKVAGPLDPQKMMSGQQRVGMKQDAGRVDIENWSLIELINAAYKVPVTRLSGPGAPTMASMLTAARFEIHATLPAGASKDDVPEMLQSLLVERFKLAYHTEKKEQSVFALVVGKDGPKLEKSPEEPPPPADAPANATNRPDAISVSGDPQKGMTIRGAGQAGALKLSMSPDGSTIRMEAEKLTMTQLADSLVQFAGRPVIDQTGLTGNYRVAFEISREDMLAMARAAGLQVPGAPAGPADAAADPGGGTSAQRSVEAMGLKLEPKKASIDYMVIDKLEKLPTED
jgi:uncharacterized protein (TIGR03435 family)